jgi:hypothetical protein
MGSNGAGESPALIFEETMRTLGTLILILVATSVRAQTVAPPIVEYSQSKVSDNFEIRNESETEPLIVTGISAHTFSVDEKGDPRFLALDPTKVSLRWSDSSLRIPPQSSREIFVEAKCLQEKVCWMALYVAIARGKNSQGVGVTELLPHTIYLGLGSIKKKETQFQFIDENSFTITNTGAGLDRPLVELWTANGKKTFGVPIFPNGTRLITSDSPITRLRLKFAHFKLDEKR